MTGPSDRAVAAAANVYYAHDGSEPHQLPRRMVAAAYPVIVGEIVEALRRYAQPVADGGDDVDEMESRIVTDAADFIEMEFG